MSGYVGFNNVFFRNIVFALREYTKTDKYKILIHQTTEGRNHIDCRESNHVRGVTNDHSRLVLRYFYHSQWLDTHIYQEIVCAYPSVVTLLTIWTGLVVTRLVWMATRLVSSKREVK